MLGNKTWPQWIGDYERSHRHPLNRLTHALGIPMIALSLPLLAFGPWFSVLLWVGVVLFVVGWVLQFIGHVAERRPPEFFRDWRFLLVGLRWWLEKYGRRLRG
jgi:uncharacterized membrane protein YGL010W